MNITASMQSYAAEIYRLQHDRLQVPVAHLTERIGASAQATAQMVRRLHNQGFLVHEPYRGIRLTDSGQQIAMPALRRHRLTEVFLVRVMRYDWSEVHDLAHTFEQGLNDELEARIDELTAHPTRCPHGEPIPSRDGVMPAINDCPLIAVAPGAECITSRVRTYDHEKLRYIAGLGLMPGEAFTLLSCAPFQGPLRLKLKRHDHVIGHELARSLWVEVIRQPGGTA